MKKVLSLMVTKRNNTEVKANVFIKQKYRLTYNTNKHMSFVVKP